MIPYFRSLGFSQMLANGAEGYRANGTFDSGAPTAYPFNDWINNGQKGAPAPSRMTEHCGVACQGLAGPSLPYVMT